MTLQTYSHRVCALLLLPLGLLVLYQRDTFNHFSMILKFCNACYLWLTLSLMSFLTFCGLSILMALTRLLLLLRHLLLALAVCLLTLSLLMFFLNYSFLLPCGLQLLKLKCSVSSLLYAYYRPTQLVLSLPILKLSLISLMKLSLISNLLRPTKDNVLVFG